MTMTSKKTNNDHKPGNEAAFTGHDIFIFT